MSSRAITKKTQNFTFTPSWLEANSRLTAAVKVMRAKELSLRDRRSRKSTQPVPECRDGNDVAGEVGGRIIHPLRLQSKDFGATAASAPATSIKTESPINS